eukprot:477806_1
MSFLFYLLILIHLIPWICDGRIIGAAIIPHGDFAFAPSLLKDSIGAQRLHTACNRVARWIMDDMQPDLIFLTTPHGLKLNRNFLVYENGMEQGYAMVGDDLHDPQFKSTKIHLNISTNKILARRLVHWLNEYGNEVEGLSSFGEHQSLPLKWAEVIPIKYLENVSKELPHLWNLLNDERITGRINIMVMISADLAHTHYTENAMPYGHCDCAPLFDKAISEWIKTMDRRYLLQTARYEQYKGSKSCGFNGFVLLQGMFDASVEDDTDWISQLLANYHPTYYGMAVGNFTRI